MLTLPDLDRAGEPVQPPPRPEDLPAPKDIDAWDHPETDFNLVQEQVYIRSKTDQIMASQHVERIRGALDCFSDVCPVCWYLHHQRAQDGSHQRHEITECPMMTKERKDRYMALSKAVHYLPNRRVWICYRCHVPVYNVAFHREYDSYLGRQSCQWYDIVIPYLFVITDQNQGVTGEIFARYQLQDRKDWLRWLGSADTEAPWASNVIRCFVEQVECRDAHLLRSDTPVRRRRDSYGTDMSGESQQGPADPYGTW